MIRWILGRIWRFLNGMPEPYVRIERRPSRRSEPSWRPKDTEEDLRDFGRLVDLPAETEPHFLRVVGGKDVVD